MHKKAGFKLIRRQSAVAVAVALTSGLAFAGYEASTDGAVDDSADLAGASSVSINVLGNDNNVDSTTLSITDAPSQGTAVLNTDGTITYTVTDPTTWTGSDTFTYTITDMSDGNSSDPVEYTLTDVAGEAPIVTSYVDSVGNTVPVYEGGVDTLNNGADRTNNVPAYFNEVTTASAGLANGVVAKTYYPSKTAAAITGCKANDTGIAPLSVAVNWNGERQAGTGDLQYFITKAEVPTDSGADIGAIEYRTTTAASINPATTIAGGLADATWEFSTNASFTGLTPEEFESLPISIMASTFTNKIWFNRGVEFVVTMDPSQCSNTSTATVTVSGTIAEKEESSGGGGGALGALLALLMGTTALRSVSRRRG